MVFDQNDCTGRRLMLRLEALEAVGVGGELVEGDVGAVEAVELLGGVALDGGDGARRSAAPRCGTSASPCSGDWPARPAPCGRRCRPAACPSGCPCCDQAAEADMPIRAATATVVIARLSMAFPSVLVRSRRTNGSPPRPGLATIRQRSRLAKPEDAAPHAESSAIRRRRRPGRFYFKRLVRAEAGTQHSRQCRVRGDERHAMILIQPNCQWLICMSP